MDPQRTQTPFVMGDASAQAVSNVALRILGTSDGTSDGSADWTSNKPSPNANRARIIDLTNCSPTLGVYIGVIASGAALAVTTASFGRYLAPLQSFEYFVPDGYELNAIRASSSTDNLRAREYLWR